MRADPRFKASIFTRLWAVTGLVVAILIGWLTLAGPAWTQSEPDAPDVLGSLAGVVRNESGDPLADIEVRVYVESPSGYPLFEQPLRTTKTDAAGVYKAAALPVGTYYLRFVDPAYLYGAEYYTNSATFEGSTALVLTGNQRTGINAVLGAGGRITGTMTLQGEALINDATLTLYALHESIWEIVSTHTVTQTGHYDSGALVPGIYRICGVTWIGGDSYNEIVGCYGGATVAAATDIVIVAGETQANREISLGEGQFDSAITGVVTADGAPRAGIQVNLYNLYFGSLSTPQAYVVTDAAGHYRIEGLGTGAYMIGFFDPAGVYATHFFYQDLPTPRRFVRVDIQGGQSAQVVSGINATLVHGGKISGTVRRPGGTPVTDGGIQLFWQTDPASQQFYNTGDFAETDSAGHYMLTGILPGSYRIGVCICQSFNTAPSEYYGSDLFLNEAKDVLVEVDKTTTGIDITLGPDYQLFLPLTPR